jgi:hypothetical protein
MGRPRRAGNDYPPYKYKGDQNGWIIKPPKGLGVTVTRYKDEELSRKTAALSAEAYEKKRLIGMVQGDQAFLMGVTGMSKTGANQWATLDRHKRCIERIERIERQLNLVSE